MTFTFQDYLTLEIDSGGRPQFDAYFLNEYARINETDVSGGNSSYKILLKIVDQLPDKLPRGALIRMKRFKELFTFEYAIVGMGTDDVTIYFKDHPVRRFYVTAVGVFLQAQVLEPVMYLSFLRQGVLLMHSAGVSKDGKAYLFPAHGGTGKTTTSLSLLGKGFSFLGDDLILVDPERRKVYPYPRPLHIFTYNVRNLQGANLPFAVEAVIYFKNVLRFFLELILSTEFLISTRVHADEIFPDFDLSPAAELHNVIFLKKKGDHESIDLSDEAAVRIHANRIAKSADLNVSLFDILEDVPVSEHIQKEEVAGFCALLRQVSYFGYLNTRRIQLDRVAAYLNNVEAKET